MAKEIMYFQVLSSQYEDASCVRYEPGDIVGPTDVNLVKAFSSSMFRKLTPKEVEVYEKKHGISHYMKPPKTQSETERVKITNIA